MNIQRNFLSVRTVVYIGVLLSIISCSKMTPTISKNVLVKLERTGCLGDCPIYTIEIKKNGDVTYEGIDYVKVIGVRKTSIHQDSVLLIESELSKAEFANMQSELHPGGWGCFISATDHSYIVIEGAVGKTIKAVSTYTGCDSEQVKLANKLADFIDRISDASNWIEQNTTHNP